MNTVCKITKFASAAVCALFLLFVVVALALGVVGCKTETVNNVSKSNNTSVVVIGMEKSRFAGPCPGAAYDAKRMRKLLGEYTSDVAYFTDATATHDAILSAIKRASASDLCVIFYSGHGGSDRFGDTGKEEVDGMDEYLCLYDTYLRDNEIWRVVSAAKGRVFLLFDCCHSQTMFRHPSFTLRRATALTATHHEDGGGVNMLCWSGCPDNTYSYGGADGGEFTNALLRHFDASKTYDDLWREIEDDMELKSFEDVQRTVIGSGFSGKAIFR